MKLETAVNRYNSRLESFSTYRAYARGDHELKFASTDFRDEMGAEMKSVRENLCGTLVSSFVDKLNVASWGSEANDALAKGYGVTRMLNTSWNEAFRCGHSFIVAARLPDGGVLPVTQRADQMIVRTDQFNPAVLSCALRFWADDDHMPRITIWEDGTVRELMANKPLQTDQNGTITDHTFPANPASYKEISISPHGFDTIPVVQFKHNSEDAWDDGISLLADAIPIQDALNKSLADTIVLSGSYAIPFWYLLRYAPKNPDNPYLAAKQLAQVLGQVAPEALSGSSASTEQRFNRSKQRIFTTDGEGPFGQLDPPDIEKMLKVQDAYALKMARVVGLPSYYLTQTSGDVPSGASLRVLSSRMTARISNFQLDSEPVLKGLGEMLGMTDVAITWEDVSLTDEVEKVNIADVKANKLGYALEDAIADLDEADVAGIVERAAAKRQAARLDLTSAGLLG